MVSLLPAPGPAVCRIARVFPALAALALVAAQLLIAPSALAAPASAAPPPATPPPATASSAAAATEPTAGPQGEPADVALPTRDSRSLVLSAGVGVLPMVHAELGVFVAPRILVEAVVGTYVFNVLAGFGGEVHLGGSGEQPRHSLTLGAHILVNPFMSIRDWGSPGAERIGVGGDMTVGWRFLADNGFLVRLNTGALIYQGSSGIEAGPTVFFLALGKAF